MTKPSPHCATCMIRGLSLLKNCSAGVLDEISKKKTSQSFKMGASLVKKDSVDSGIYCIRSGVVKAEVQNKKNGTLILRLEGKGTIVGYRTAGAMARQPLAITAVEEVQACYLSAEGFRSILSDSPELRNEINKALLSEIRSIEQKALSLATNTVRERIAEALLHIAQVYQYKERGRSVHTHLDRQDIADMAGTTREQVSKVLAEFRRSGLIKFRAKHLKYFDLAGLRKVAMLSNDNLV
ncbi:MAG TPA: Crp/Fnr family transcriptional regulator [Puia sp.]|nr:Crp/Fnr family transcriptional regulator [Puia sp.]